MQSVGEIIEAFGGVTAFGKAIGVAVSTASEMKRRDSIPVRHWQRVLAAAKKRRLALKMADLLLANTSSAKTDQQDSVRA
jgi:hypothetical protein